MAKFKVGDRVVAGKLCSPLWHRYYGDSTKNAKIVCVLGDGMYHIKLESKLPYDDGLWVVLESELTPLAPIPDGWTSADEPPDSDRNVRVTLNDGHEWYGWYYEGGSEDVPAWLIIHDGEDMSRINADKLCDARDAAPGEVIGWREIEPDAKPKPDARVRYAVAAELPTSITVWHDSYDAAAAEAKRLCVKCGKPFRMLKVVAEVKPGKPEIVKLEE